jgi:DNA-directed RNA polymerase subunit RPC12/RpoP
MRVRHCRRIKSEYHGVVCAPATCQRRRPEESVLPPCIVRHWPAVREPCEETHHPLPHFVERDVTRPLHGPSPAGFAFGKVALHLSGAVRPPARRGSRRWSLCSCFGLDSFLRCGFLEHGFARIHCPGCGHERLVAFSCKGRGFCPSCGGRRLTRAHPWALALRAAMALQAIPS